MVISLNKDKKVRHIIKSQQFEVGFLQSLFHRVAQIKKQFENGAGRVILRQRLSNKLLINLFYEASTRTRLSFAAAAYHLGMNVMGTENAREFSSAIKGETLEDSIKVLCHYCPDAIVIRHHEEGSVAKAAEISNVSIINAGDGKGQHPTQALLDLYTVWERLKTLNNLKILVGGDLAYGRTVRSLVYLLSKFQGTEFIFCAPEVLRMQPDIKDHLDEHSIPYVEVFENISKVIPLADVVYWTRIQKERIEANLDLDQITKEFTIDMNTMALMKPFSILMHPLPRVHEITTDVDSDIRAAYFEQAGNGMYVRMALLEWILT
jgi:aspartate carbamoyltransferase catalytic subunit